MKKLLPLSFIIALSLLYANGFSQQTKNFKQRSTVLPHYYLTDYLPQPSAKTVLDNKVYNNEYLKKPSACTQDTLMFEDFQTKQVPAGWLNIDYDQSADANGRSLDWFTGQVGYTPEGDTNWAVTTSSWFTVPGKSNNWLITTPVTICDTSIMLIWKSAPFEGPAYMDGYRVLISTTTSDTASFTDTLALFAEDLTGTGVTSPGVVHSNFNGTRGVFQEWKATLKAYNGQQVYIAFVHDSNNDNLLAIDDVFVGNLPKNDHELVAVAGTEYFIMPYMHIDTLSYRALIKNNGTVSNNPGLHVQVTNWGNLAYENSINIPTLANNQDSALTLPTVHVPADTGVYTVKSWVESDVIDDIPHNDTIFSFFVVDDTVYARDNNYSTQTLSIGPGLVGVISQLYDVNVQDELTSVTYLRGSKKVGDSVRAVIYWINPLTDSPDTAVSWSDWYVATDTIGGWNTIPITQGGTQTLQPGQYTVGIQESFGTELALGASSNAFFPRKMWVLTGGFWRNSEEFNYNVGYLIRANFGLGFPASVPISQVPEFDVNLYPNPVTDQLTLEFGESLNSNRVKVSVLNILGEEMLNIETNSNTSKLQLNVSELSSGIYFANIQTGNQQITKRFVVK